MASATYIYREDPDADESSNNNDSGVPSSNNIQRVTLTHSEVTSHALRPNRDLLVSVQLPMGLKVIRERAFAKCTSLKTIDIPSSVQIIQHGAFQNAKLLETMHLPEGLAQIAAETFQHCESLRNVHISTTVLDIGRNAFWGCRNLPHVDLPPNLTRIGPGVFMTCRSLSRILIPSTVTSIASMAFSGCVALRSVEISISNNKDGLRSIESYAFNICTNLLNIAVPSCCNVSHRACRGCEHAVFDDLYDAGSLGIKLKNRFRDLPYHKMCYQQGHDTEEATKFIQLSNNSDKSHKSIDFFGFTPFHILALSARPNIDVLKKLLEATSSPDGLLRLDKSRATPLRYAVESFAPNALEFIKALLHAMIDKRIQGLGLDVWKSDLLEKIDSLEGNEILERTNRIHTLFALLRLYERKESISLLEQAVWKHKLDTNNDEKFEPVAKRIKVEGDVSRRNDDHRQKAYLNSGAGTVIVNILPYLGNIVKTLNFYISVFL